MIVPPTTGARAITGPVQRTEGLLTRRVLDELLVMTPTGKVVLLSGSAAQVWRALEHHDDVQGLVTRLSEVFHAPFGVVADDVTGLLDELASQGLVESARPSVDEP